MIALGLRVKPQLIQTMVQENPKEIRTYGNYECPRCGERHASDTTQYLCKPKEVVSPS